MFLAARPYPTTPTGRFTAVIQALRYAVADQGKAQSVAIALLILINNRIAALARRFNEILARGPLAPRSATPRPINPATPPKPRKPDQLPRAYGWLRRIVPDYRVNGHIAQFQHLLTEPDMLALIETNPALGRALRPLCHIFGIPQPPALQRPKPEPKPASPRPELKKSRRSARPRLPVFPPLPPPPTPSPGNHYVIFAPSDPKKTA
ncbi:MAG: hypothetical protein ACYCZB_00360 [Acidiphilium sp.]